MVWGLPLRGLVPLALAFVTVNASSKGRTKRKEKEVAKL